MNQNQQDLQALTEKASAIKKSYQAELMAKPHVVGVGVGFRQIGGERTDTIALIVMVDRKLPRSHLAPEDMLPTEIDGLPVDVQEVGEIKAL